MNNSKRLITLSGTLAVCAFTTAACSTLPEPGEYVVYRVAAGEAELSDGCFATGVPANLREDSSTVRTNGIFMLFASNEEGVYHLDIGPATLDGTYEGAYEEGDGFYFEGESKDVTYSCSDGTGSRSLAITRTMIDLLVDGEYISGKMKARTRFSCEGAECGEQIPDCAVTVHFVGNEIEDVVLEQDVGAGDNSPVPEPVQAQPTQSLEPPTGIGGNCSPTCGHSECQVGGPLDPSCNACAFEVCNGGSYECCAEGGGWDTNCIAEADYLCDEYNGDHCPAFP